MGMILFADDQVITANTEDNLQFGTHKLNNISKKYSLEISTVKTKVIAFKGDKPVRAKIIIENNTLEKVNRFNYLGFNITYADDKNVYNNVNKFRHVWNR